MNDQEKLVKSLADLIDETIVEIEELKKSSRFSASEVKIDGPGQDGIEGQSANGKLGKEEEKEDEEDEEEDEEKEEKDDAKKYDGVNKEAEVKKEEAAKAEGKNSEADPGKRGVTPPDEAPIVKSEQLTAEVLEKSRKEQEELMKSYVDSKIDSMESKLVSISEMLKSISEQPVAAKGITSKMVPLQKNDSEVESLSKAEVADMLFELKKSGNQVDSADIAMAEVGGDLEPLIQKYNLK